jgi:type VI secretion system protein ImpJ
VKQLSKIVWSEGMYLGPHHFQAQSKFFENLLQFTTSALHTHPYGFLGFELDQETLRNGVVSLVHGRGVLPDGLAFQIPESDTRPAPRKIAELFPPTANRLFVYLGIPEYRPGESNCALVNGTPTAPVRFSVEERPVSDENTGFDEKPVRFGRKNLQLLLENEPAERMVRLPVACVERDGAGGFRYDRTFIPPCLKINASPRLMEMLSRLTQILTDKSTWLNKASRSQGVFVAGMSAQQVATFWFLHAINTGLTPLRHMLLLQQSHPEQLFIELLRLGGALCTFTLDANPKSLPQYDHLNPTDCFTTLDRQIRAYLEVIIPTNCVSIPLVEQKPYFHNGVVADKRCFGPSRWILAVRSPMGEGDLIREVPRLVKVCSAAFTPELVKRALPGMKLTHLSSPPAAISPRADWQYFVVDRSGPFWDHIVQTTFVGAYFPEEIPHPESEMLIVLDS